MIDSNNRTDARYLAVAITSLLKDKKMSSAELSRISKINGAQVSRITTGVQIWVNPDDIFKIAGAFCRPKDQEGLARIHGKLVYARLQDELAQQARPGSRYVSIDFTDSAPFTLKDEPAPAKRILPAGIQADLNAIENSIMENPHVRRLIKSIARMVSGRPLPQARSKKSS